MADGRSLGGRARRYFVGAGVVAVGAALFSAFTVGQVLSAREELVEDVHPAQLDHQRLGSALLDQETGVRGFVLTRDERFLTPYDDGRERVDDLLGTIEDRLAGRSEVAADVDGIVAAIERWEADYAEPTIELTRSGDDAVREEAALQAGRDLFDEVRDELGVLGDDLTELRGQARDDLDQATVLLTLSLLSLSVVIFAGGVTTWRAYRRSVEAPLLDLEAAAERIQVGDLERPIEVRGPMEVERLARTMDDMRARLVDQLAMVERSNQDLEQFAYVASHDLQEPLRKVASFTQLLQQRYAGELDERADQYIEFAVDGAKRMQLLINDLLAFSRVGRDLGDLERVDLQAVVDRVRTTLSLLVEETEAVIAVGELPTVAGESTLYAALFQNLIGNAIKFRRPGTPPHVRIDSRAVPDGFEVTVADDGIGIEPEYAERVFEIFKRLHAKSAYEGTGIGLALCRKIVESFGGRIRVDTEVESGTCIRLVLPPPPEQEEPQP